MKQNIYSRGYFIAALIILTASCAKKEEALTPTTVREISFTWPEGNNDYDQRIAKYYDRFGCFLLYRFSDKEAYWSIRSWDTTYKLKPADPLYVYQQLDLLDTTFFRYYADSTLREYLPSRVLLCSSITTSSTIPKYVAQQDCYLTATNNVGYVYANFPVNWGSSRINNIKGAADSVAIFRGNVNYAFLRLTTLRGKINRPAGFDALSDYTTPFSPSNQAEYYKRGFVGAYPGYSPGVTVDWENYLKAIVQNSYAYLTDGTGISVTDGTFKGILSPVKDPNGAIRRKYDYVIGFYKNNYNIDLQRIGNGSL